MHNIRYFGRQVFCHISLSGQTKITLETNDNNSYYYCANFTRDMFDVKASLSMKRCCRLILRAGFLLVSHASVQAIESPETWPRMIVFDNGLLDILAAMELDNHIILMPNDPTFTGQYPDARLNSHARCTRSTRSTKKTK